MRKGEKMSEESRAKMRVARARHSGPNKGKTFSAEYRAKLSAAHKGIPSPRKGVKTGKPAWNRGLPATWVQGEKNPRWQGGITPLTRRDRESIEYRTWRAAVFERDAYTCQKCGQVGGRLQADHIKMWALYPELRFDISNGQTLCFRCHRAKTNEDMRQNWVNQHGAASDSSNPVITNDVNVVVTYL